MVNVLIENFSFASQKIKSFGWLRREISKKSRSEDGGERNGVVNLFVRKKKTIYRWGWNLAVGGRFLRSPEVPAMDRSSGPRKFRPGSGLHREFASSLVYPGSCSTWDGNSGARKFRPARKFRRT